MEVLKVAVTIAISSFVLLSIGAWYSVKSLDTYSDLMERFNTWLQLRIRARRAGLIAYRFAVSTVLYSNKEQKFKILTNTRKIGTL